MGSLRAARTATRRGRPPPQPGRTSSAGPRRRAWAACRLGPQRSQIPRGPSHLSGQETAIFTSLRTARGWAASSDALPLLAEQSVFLRLWKVGSATGPPARSCHTQTPAWGPECLLPPSELTGASGGALWGAAGVGTTAVGVGTFVSPGQTRIFSCMHSRIGTHRRGLAFRRPK